MVVISGRGGDVRVGYQVVAKLGTWTLRDGLLTADGSEIDAYWITQDGTKTLRVPVGNSTWSWRGVDASASGTTLLVRVTGSPERR
jgi:hypothetical protein